MNKILSYHKSPLTLLCREMTAVAFRKVVSIQPHFLLRIYLPTISCSPCMPVQRFFQAIRYWRSVSDNYLWMDESSLVLLFVRLHISDPQRSTDFIFELKMAALSVSWFSCSYRCLIIWKVAILSVYDLSCWKLACQSRNRLSLI